MEYKKKIKKKKPKYQIKSCRGKKGGCYFHGEIVGETKLRIAA